MGEIQSCQNSPLPCLSTCQSEISQQPRRGRSILVSFSFLLLPPPPHPPAPSYLFPPSYGHNDMSGDQCQCWYGDIDMAGIGEITSLVSRH